jgi:hypothetical protein
MATLEPYPTLDPDPDRAARRGHLWLRECVVGAGLRFGIGRDGRLLVGDTERVYPEGEVPLPLRFAARHVRERLDREALRTAVDDPGRVVMFGVATRFQGIAYHWDRLPPVLGTEIHDGTRGELLPVDAAERAFQRLGLDPVNAVEKEVNARDFDPDRYEFPPSEWYPGPAAGVVVRNRDGRRGLLCHPAYDPEDLPPPVEDADEAAALCTDERLRAVVEELVDLGRPVTPEATVERALDRVVREEYARLYRDGHPVVDGRAFRSQVAERTRRWLDDQR